MQKYIEEREEEARKEEAIRREVAKEVERKKDLFWLKVKIAGLSSALCSVVIGGLVIRRKIRKFLNDEEKK